MRTFAILPVKSFDEAKHRLEGDLVPASRRELAEAMFTDVLLALHGTSALDEILVVTGDPRAQRIAARLGTGTIDDDDRGHNTAASLGVRAALRSGADRALLVPGDCPALDPAEVERLLVHPAGPRSVLIVPDRHGTGTNALLIAPPDAITPSFGPGSCQRHLRLARDAGAGAKIVESSTLAMDVDTADDLTALHEALVAAPDRAENTRNLLGRLVPS